VDLVEQLDQLVEGDVTRVVGIKDAEQLAVLVVAQKEAHGVHRLHKIAVAHCPRLAPVAGAEAVKELVLPLPSGFLEQLEHFFDEPESVPGAPRPDQLQPKPLLPIERGRLRLGPFLGANWEGGHMQPTSGCHLLVFPKDAEKFFVVHRLIPGRVETASKILEVVFRYAQDASHVPLKVAALDAPTMVLVEASQVAGNVAAMTSRSRVNRSRNPSVHRLLFRRRSLDEFFLLRCFSPWHQVDRRLNVSHDLASSTIFSIFSS
jgi:hypothetical protein